MCKEQFTEEEIARAEEMVDGLVAEIDKKLGPETLALLEKLLKEFD